MQTVKVADLVTSKGDWNQNALIHQLPENVQNRMVGILTPQENGGHDVRDEFADDRKEFSISRMYSTLDDNQYIDTNNKWKWICKMIVPKRVLCFIWKLSYDRLLTNKNKSCMGVSLSMCNYRGNVKENSLHILRDFSFVMFVWIMIVVLSGKLVIYTITWSIG